MSSEATWAMVVTVGILVLCSLGIITHCSNESDRLHCAEKSAHPEACK